MDKFFPMLGNKRTKPVNKKNTFAKFWEIKYRRQFPTEPQQRNFMSQCFPNNGKISHLIPKWEFQLVSCAREVKRRAFLISVHLSKASGVQIRAFPVQFRTFCANNYWH